MHPRTEKGENEAKNKSSRDGFELYLDVLGNANSGVGLERLSHQISNYPISPVAEVYEQDR